MTRYLLLLALAGCGGSFELTPADESHHDARESDQNVQNETGEDAGEAGGDSSTDHKDSGSSGPETGDPECPPDSQSIKHWERCLGAGCSFDAASFTLEDFPIACGCDHSCVCLRNAKPMELPLGCGAITGCSGSVLPAPYNGPVACCAGDPGCTP